MNWVLLLGVGDAVRNSVRSAFLRRLVLVTLMLSAWSAMARGQPRASMSAKAVQSDPLRFPGPSGGPQPTMGQPAPVAASPGPAAEQPSAPTVGTPADRAGRGSLSLGLQPQPSATWVPIALPYRSGDPIPAGYHVEDVGSPGLVYGGLALAGIPYVAGVAAAAGYGFSHGSIWLLLPVAGPFIAMGDRNIDCQLDRFQYDPNVELKDIEQQCLDSAVDEVTAIAFLTASGLFQTSGALLMLVGAASSEQQLVRNDVAGVSLLPIAGPGLLGAAASGRF